MKLVGSDLRSSAALVIAALISKEISYIYGLEHLDRGYENFEVKLSKLGVEIIRETTKKTTVKPDHGNQDKCLKKISDIKAA